MNFKKKLGLRFKTFYKKNFRRFHGLKNIDQKMLEYLNYDNGFFVELGAHDGIHNSNTFFYEKQKFWKGILIEPSFNFELLKKNRSKYNKFFNCACSEFETENETILLNSDDYSICKNLVDEDYLKWHLNKQIQAGKVMKETKVKLRTLNSLLIEADAPKLIDFFSLDVEGMELNVLKGIDFQKYNFKFLVIECASEKKFLKILTFLKIKKYEYIKKITEWDYLFRFEKT